MDTRFNVKLPAHRTGLPRHAVASRMRANEISFFIGPLEPLGPSNPAYKVGLAVHLPVYKKGAGNGLPSLHWVEPWNRWRFLSE